MIVLIVLLLIFNIKMSGVSKEMEIGCQIDYSNYLENETCPCRLSSIDFLNLSNISMSINQKNDIKYNINPSPSQ